MKKTLLINLLFIFCLCAFPQEDVEEEIEHSPQNSKCFNCHGGTTYTYFNDVVERNVTKRMNPYFIIDSVLFYDQNHKSFECIDCHSYDYRNFPHDGELRMEEFPACIDSALPVSEF